MPAGPGDASRLPTLLDQVVSDFGFVDPDHGWVTEADTARFRSFVFSTTNGGDTWTRSNVIGVGFAHAGDGLRVEFRDTTTGCCCGRPKSVRGASFARTNDGGRTWSRMNGLPVASAVRFFGCCAGVETGYERAGPALFFPSDAGRHWHPSDVPLPSGWKFANPGLDVDWDLPRMFGSGTGVLAVPLERPDRRVDLAFYGTADGGAAWTFRSSVVTGAHPFGPDGCRRNQRDRVADVVVGGLG